MRKYFPVEKDLDGFNEFLPSDHIPVAGLPDAIRDQKSAWLNTISVRAIFSAEVEDGDLVVPVVRDETNDWYHPDTVWVPALGPDAVMRAENEADNVYQPKFYGMAYKGINRVMLGPLVYHPTYKFRAGDVLYATANGKMTTEQTEVFVGACLAPGYVLLHGTAQNVDLFKKAAEFAERAETAASTSVEKVAQVVEIGESHIKRIEELAEQLTIIGTSYNKYTVADISAEIAEGTQMTLPEYEGAQMSYIVGSNTLLLCCNGDWMLPGEQYTEVGTAGLPSSVIQLNQELHPGDKLGVLILSPYAKVLLSSDSGLSFDENGALYIASVTAEGTEDTRTLSEWVAAIHDLEQPILADGSTTARPLNNRFADVVNVKDFGAVGDGVTDDSQAFIDAYNYAISKGTRPFVPYGVYYLSRHVPSIQADTFYCAGTEPIYTRRHLIVTRPLYDSEVYQIGTHMWSNFRCAYRLKDASKIAAFMEVAKAVKVYAANKGFTYGHYNTIPMENASSIDCSGYVFWVLHNFGYTELAGTMQPYEFQDNAQTAFFDSRPDDFERITSISALQYGDIVFSGTSTSKFPMHAHMSIYIDRNNGYSCGSDAEIAVAGSVTQRFGFIRAGSSMLVPGFHEMWASGMGYPLRLGNDGIKIGEPGPTDFTAFTAMRFVDKEGDNIAQLLTNSGSVERQFAGTFTQNNGKLAGFWFTEKYDSTDTFHHVFKLTANDLGQSDVLIYPVTMYLRQRPCPVTDGATSLGFSGAKWSEVFAVNGVINTSDIREKTAIEPPSDALMRAWGKVEFSTYQMSAAVEKKGASARIHVGVIAQQVMEAFASEGLDATRYGLLCYDEWEDAYDEEIIVDRPEEIDSDGELVRPAETHTERRLITAAGNRYGIRYEEALALECAYQRWRLSKLEEKMASLS